MRGLDAVEFGDIRIRQWRRDPQPFMEGADAFLAAGDPQQVLVDGPVPLPVETVAGEGMVEGLPMQLFGLGQGAVDIEDQRGRAADQLRRAGCTVAGASACMIDASLLTSDHRPHWRASKIAISFAGPKNLL